MSTVFDEIQKYWDLIFQYKISKLILGAIITFIIVKIINRFVRGFFKRTHFIEERKEKTLEAMIRSILNYTALFTYVLFVLSTFGVEVGQLLAGAGILGIVIGFGAQSIITDIFSGIFLIYEKQLLKGDYVTVNDTYNGTVEDIGLRFLKIREWSGKLITISNGQVKTIKNYNQGHMRVIEEVTTSFYEDPNRSLEVLEIACEKLNKELSQYLKIDASGKPIEPYQIYGMTSLNNQFHGYKFTIIGLVEDDVFWAAAREARLIIARTLFEHGIEMAIQNVELRSALTKE